MARKMTIQDPRLKTLPRRLKSIVDSCGSLTNLSNKSGVGVSSLSRYLKGVEPSLSAIVAICSSTSHSVEWLATGLGSPSVASSDYLEIPYYDVQASAGHGAFALDSISTESITLPKVMLGANYAKSGSLRAIQTHGDSMEPTLKDGSIIVIDENNKTPVDGIHVLRRAGTLLVKRLQLRERGILRLISDNKSYEPEDINVEENSDSFSILGRVVWSGHNC